MVVTKVKRSMCGACGTEAGRVDRDWHYRVPALHINGGGTLTLDV
jgi:predicted ATPase